MRVTATFVTSAAGAGDFPRDGLAEVAFVGRSNVGKSSLINALVRQRVARTSAAPGKTRLANVYRVVRGGRPMYLVDLPGYGYARGGSDAARAFDDLTRTYFGQPGQRSALLLVDARHPGLPSDVQAWRWLRASVDRSAVVATKVDKLSRAERQRAIVECEAVLEHPVLPVSAATAEGLDELWNLIDRLASNRNPNSPRHNPAASRRSPGRRQKATAARHPRR